jgi:cytoskeletal protein RodZ
MYRFNYQQNQPRNPRRRRGFLGFPWWMFFAFFWIAPGRFQGVLIGVGLIVFVIFMIARYSNFQGWMGNQQQYNPPVNQTPYQQPYYQPTPPQQAPASEASQAYSQYQQGYQYQPPAAGELLNSEGPYQVPSEPLQEEYEQPRAEYPQQMPPM